MKLYATLTSERASKGQGGNEYVEVELKAFDRVRVVGHVVISVEEDADGKPSQYLIRWYPDGLDEDGDEGYSDPVILKEGHLTEGEIQCLREGRSLNKLNSKGKKQKGEYGGSQAVC